MYGRSSCSFSPTSRSVVSLASSPRIVDGTMSMASAMRRCGALMSKVWILRESLASIFAENCMASLPACTLKSVISTAKGLTNGSHVTFPFMPRYRLSMGSLGERLLPWLLMLTAYVGSASPVILESWRVSVISRESAAEKYLMGKLPSISNLLIEMAGMGRLDSLGFSSGLVGTMS